MATKKYNINSRNIYETKVWDGTYDSSGKKHRVRITSKKSSRDLENKVNEFKEQIKNQTFAIPTDYTFTEYANHWLEVKKCAKEKNTQKMYRNIIDTHLSFLSEIKLSDIKNSHFQKAVNNQIDHPRTCQQIFVTFKQIIRMASTDGYLSENDVKNIFTDISLPKYRKPEKRPLNDIEKDAFKKVVLSDRDRAFLNIIYYCGLRKGEALALSIFDFDFDKNYVSINKDVIFVNNNPEIKRIPKSEYGIRKVPLTKEATNYFKDYISSINTTNLFTSTNTYLMTKSAYDKMWTKIVKEMNYCVGGTNAFPKITGLTAHVFRHNFCTNLCYQIPTVSIKKIAEILGDTEKMVIDIYNHIMEEKENVSDAIENALAI